MPAEFQDGPKSLSEASVPEVNASYRSQPYRYSSSDPVPSYSSGVTGCPGAVLDILVDEDRLAQQRFDRGDVGRVHLLGRVPAEAVHAERDQAVQVAGLLLLHVAGPGVQVGQAAQLAVPHLRLVIPVGDRGVAAVEVGLAVQRRVVEHVRERRPVVPDPAVDLAGHVVQHHVGVHLDARRVAGRDHRRELGLGAEPGVQAVADRLVGLPPRVAVGGQHHGFLRRGDLHRCVPVRAEHVAALRADSRPRPVEHLPR